MREIMGGKVWMALVSLVFCGRGWALRGSGRFGLRVGRLCEMAYNPRSTRLVPYEPVAGRGSIQHGSIQLL